METLRGCPSRQHRRCNPNPLRGAPDLLQRRGVGPTTSPAHPPQQRFPRTACEPLGHAKPDLAGSRAFLPRAPFPYGSKPGIVLRIRRQSRCADRSSQNALRQQVTLNFASQAECCRALIERFADCAGYWRRNGSISRSDVLTSRPVAGRNCSSEAPVGPARKVTAATPSGNPAHRPVGA